MQSQTNKLELDNNIKQNKMDKLKRIWNLVLVPTAFFLGALNMWIGETGVGCLFILFATNETINNDRQIK
jgi:hypothetical protein